MGLINRIPAKKSICMDLIYQAFFKINQIYIIEK